MALSLFAPPGLGWQRDLPDWRDWTPAHMQVRAWFDRLAPPELSDAPTRIDLREYFLPATDPQRLNASTAFACVGLFEYFQARVHGALGRRAPLFLYKVTRKLLRQTGDTGAPLRATLRALVRFGVPLAEHCSADIEHFDHEPDPFLYGFSDEFRAIRYLRLDARNADGGRTLATVKAFLAAGLPCAFGFCVPASLSRESDIPYRVAFDGILGGNAAVVVGYDDRRIRSTVGALLIRTSWGSEWGEEGYGWLPYAYIEQQLAADFWTIIRPDWLESGEFDRPRAVPSE